jgi:hypothetical protein
VDGSRDCETEIVVEPTVTVPLLARPLFWATLNSTDPLPAPLSPDVIVIQGPVAVEVQEQSLSVDTLIETVPPT